MQCDAHSDSHAQIVAPDCTTEADGSTRGEAREWLRALLLRPLVVSRGPEDHINTRISHSGFKAQYKGIQEAMFCRILMFMICGLFGALVSAVCHRCAIRCCQLVASGQVTAALGLLWTDIRLRRPKAPMLARIKH